MGRELNERIALACRLADQFPLKTLTDRAATHRDGSPPVIPRRCIQTAEQAEFGTDHHAVLQELRQRNPDLDFLIFDRARRDAYMAQHWNRHPIGNIYQRARFGAMRADIFRYCVIHDQGGFYLDINKVLIQPLSSFVAADNQGLISFERNWCQLPAPPRATAQLQHPDRYIAQWCFAFTAGHSILRAMIQNICRYAPAFEHQSFEDPSQAIRSLTGPGLFTQTVRDHLEQRVDPQLRQAGIDFNGTLRYPAERDVMYLGSPHYKDSRNEPILS